MRFSRTRLSSRWFPHREWLQTNPVTGSAIMLSVGIDASLFPNKGAGVSAPWDSGNRTTELLCIVSQKAFQLPSFDYNLCPSKKSPFTLKQLLQENWDHFLDTYRDEVGWYMALNVWRVTNLPDNITPPARIKQIRCVGGYFFHKSTEKNIDKHETPCPPRQDGVDGINQIFARLPLG